MRLDQLLDAAGVPHTAQVPAGGWPEVTGVALDSRRVQPGDLFVAVVGERFDGRRFVPQALEAGAVAVLGPAPEAELEVDVAGVEAVGIEPVWIEYSDPRRVLSALSRHAYGDPSSRLRLVGITGTNGKSTLVTLMQSVFEAAGERAASLGTLGYHFAGRDWPGGGRTTPEAPDLHRLFADMLAAGARSVAMEVSSHALELGRVEGLSFDVAAFSNLSRDHLDFHGDMESYFAAKKKLFDQLSPGGTAVVHLDAATEWGQRLAGDLRRRGLRVLTCGELGSAQIRPFESRLDLDGIEARLASPAGEIHLRSPLLGRFQLLNLITAAACGVALGLEISAIERGLSAVEVVPGRLERVRGPLTKGPLTKDPLAEGPPALVDYSHTPGALEAALRSTRELTERKIVVVFGCGGERDQGKRPEMGRVAGLLADLPVLTSDNPRREDPARIAADAEKGLVEAGCGDYRVEIDRRAAIELAVRWAADNDAMVVVAGRGHETQQDLGDKVVPFDDRVELARALARVEAKTRRREPSGSNSGSNSEPSGPSSGPASKGRALPALELCHG